MYSEVHRLVKKTTLTTKQQMKQNTCSNFVTIYFRKKDNSYKITRPTTSSTKCPNNRFREYIKYKTIIQKFVKTIIQKFVIDIFDAKDGQQAALVKLLK